MAKKGHKPEEVVAKLRQVDVLVSQGQSVAEAIRAIGVTEVTYYRWRREFGGLKSDQVKRLKELEAENARLRKAVADLTLGQADPGGGRAGKLLGPARRRACVEHIVHDDWASPSAAPARRSASTARRSARRRGAATTRSGSPPTSSSWRGSTAATATARSRPCCGMRAGW